MSFLGFFSRNTNFHIFVNFMSVPQRKDRKTLLETDLKLTNNSDPIVYSFWHALYNGNKTIER